MKKIICTAVMATCTLAGNAQLKLQPNNIDAIVKAMTLEEKATLVVGTSRQGSTGGNQTGNGIVGAHADAVPGAAGTTQPIQRLGIPASILTDGPAGVRINPTRKGDSQTYYCTGFPVGTALACTWNQELVEEVGKAIGNEVLEYGCDVLLAPGMNIHRSPLCGRNFEYYSEDPLVTGKIAAAYVRGIQSQGVGTSVKHFAVNSQETRRTEVDEIVSQRALREIYLKGFEIAVREANPWTVMSSYNRLNGPFTQESKDLLTTILRDEWGFDGIVMTDWTGQRNTGAQIKAGNDLMEPGTPAQTQELIDKVKSGELKMEELDICVKRILQYLVKTPKFRNYVFSNKPDLKAHAQVTRQTATEAMVLLKNDQATLPLQGQPKVSVFGITSYDFIAGGTGSGDVNKAYTIDLMTGLKNAGVSVNDKLAAVYLSYKDFQNKMSEATPRYGWFWGKEALPELPLNRRLVEAQANESDVAVITLGRQAGEGGDRKEEADFNLSDTEKQLIKDVCDAFHAKSKHVIVILNMGNVLETASWKEQPDAILLAWQPGQEGGNSVADVLTGKANPSGKLSMTWPITLMDVPSSQNFPNVRKGGMINGKREFDDFTLHKEGLNVGYRYFCTEKKPVSYPFGFGLSYTTFAYSKPSVKTSGKNITATITVTNTGSTAGKEAVELYVSAPNGGLEKPAMELKAFGKTRELKPGESQTLTLKMTAYDLASYNEATQSWETAAGQYTAHFAASADDIRTSATFKMSKSAVKCHDVLRPTMEL